MPNEFDRLRERLERQEEQARRTRERLKEAEARAQRGDETAETIQAASTSTDPGDTWQHLRRATRLPLDALVVVYGDPRTYHVRVRAVDLNGATAPSPTQMEIALGEFRNLAAQDAFRNRVSPYCGAVMPRFKSPQWDAIVQLMLNNAEHRRADSGQRRRGMVNEWLARYVHRGTEGSSDYIEALLWRDDFDEDRIAYFKNICEQRGPTVKDAKLRFGLTPFRDWLFSPRSGFRLSMHPEELSGTLRGAGVRGPKTVSLYYLGDGRSYTRAMMVVPWPLEEEHMDYPDEEAE